MLDLSVVVMFTHDGSQAARCLDSISKHVVGEIECEVILVLNNSSEAVRDAVRASELNPIVIDSPTNLGTSVGWQLAFNAAKGRYVLLMHEDAEATAGMAQRLIATLDEDPAAAVVGPWLIEREASEPNNCGWAWFRDQSQIRLGREHIPDEMKTQPYAIDGISSAISLWDHASWREGNGFDERNFPAMGVDADTMTSAWARGRSVLVDPRAIGIHRTGAMDSAPGRLSGKFVRYLMLERFIRLWFEKWGEIDDWFLEAPGDGDREQAAGEALMRAQQRRDTLPRMKGVFPRAQHPLTDPDGTGEVPTSVSDQLALRLRAAELEAMDEYHLWLIEHSERQHAEIEHLSEATREMSAREADRIEHVERQDQAIADLQALLERSPYIRTRRALGKVRRLLAPTRRS